ncbi:MAG: protein kinase [Labilithrix sp.]|nr:protein kinase [Labilithrix sp.]
MPRAGDVVAGKYAIVRVLGEGGMGVVFEATHQRLRQRVALKMLLPAMLAHGTLVSRFEREARAAARLRGRHCARVNDVDVTPEGLPYMVMDFLEGHDLQVELERRGRLPVAEAADYVLQAAAAMLEAHQLGIVHRDLKPSNLFLQRDRAGPASDAIVKVLDFGISKVATGDEAKLTAAGAIVGTALYMSPEQLQAAHAVDARADIWALGVILYEALSGRVPWEGPPPLVAAMIVTRDPPDLRELCEVPAELAAIVNKCLERDPARRFGDVRQLATALASFAPIGTAGRSFADGVVATGADPRVAIASMASAFPPSPSLAPPDDSEENAKTVIHAPGVAEEVMRPHETAAGWSHRSPPPSRGRAALVGVLVALVVVGSAIGGVALFVRRPRAVVGAPLVPSSPPSGARIDASAVAPASPPIDPLGAGSAPVSPAPSVAPAPHLSSRPAHPARAATTSSGGATAAPSPPPRPTASTADRPLFL